MRVRAVGARRAQTPSRPRRTYDARLRGACVAGRTIEKGVGQRSANSPYRALSLEDVSSLPCPSACESAMFVGCLASLTCCCQSGWYPCVTGDIAEKEHMAIAGSVAPLMGGQKSMPIVDPLTLTTEGDWRYHQPLQNPMHLFLLSMNFITTGNTLTSHTFSVTLRPPSSSSCVGTSGALSFPLLVPATGCCGGE